MTPNNRKTGSKTRDYYTLSDLRRPGGLSSARPRATAAAPPPRAPPEATGTGIRELGEQLRDLRERVQRLEGRAASSPTLPLSPAAPMQKTTAAPTIPATGAWCCSRQLEFQAGADGMHLARCSTCGLTWGRGRF